MTAITYDVHEEADRSLSEQFGKGFNVMRVRWAMMLPEKQYTVCGTCGQTGEHEPLCPESEVVTV